MVPPKSLGLWLVDCAENHLCSSHVWNGGTGKTDLKWRLHALVGTSVELIVHHLDLHLVPYEANVQQGHDLGFVARPDDAFEFKLLMLVLLVLVVGVEIGTIEVK